MIGMVANAPAERDINERNLRRSKVIMRGNSGWAFYTLTEKKKKGGEPPLSPMEVELKVRSSSARRTVLAVHPDPSLSKYPDRRQSSARMLPGQRYLPDLSCHSQSFRL